MKLPEIEAHQNGELSKPIKKPICELIEDKKLAVDTFGGRVHVEWDPQSFVTPLGQLPFFIDFLKLGNLLEPWINLKNAVATIHHRSKMSDVFFNHHPQS